MFSWTGRLAVGPFTNWFLLQVPTTIGWPKKFQNADLLIKLMSPQARSYGVLRFVGSFGVHFPTVVENELANVDKGITEVVEEETVMEQDAVGVPGIVCIEYNEVQDVP